CQAETGSASGMAAGGIVQMMGGTIHQGLAAASMALQNIIGLACDPVANRVEVPCLGKNIQASLNALASANMSLAGMDPVIPLDEVIMAMDKAGRSLPRNLRCTGLGGLSVTPSSKKIEVIKNVRK
ncbi:MAG: L-serine ammonia-lyase, iron-sulfur-dependent, subunit alpha, partial [Bacteroidales bacterium]